MDSQRLFESPDIALFSWETATGVAAVLLAIGLWVVLIRSSSGRDPNYHYADLAWLRAGIYFCLCLALSSLTGVLTTLARRPLFTPENLASSGWLMFTAACVLVEVIGYWMIWPIGTLTYDRVLHWPSVLGFGLLWGLSEGQLFLTFWALVESLITQRWLVALITFVLLSAFIGLWHNRYWDIYVAPEHNHPEWYLPKVFLVHTPNLVCTLTYLTIYDNIGLFIFFQIIALVGSTFFMRFPPFWAGRGAPLNTSTAS